MVQSLEIADKIALHTAYVELRSFSSSTDSTSLHEDVWTEFISRALLQPAQHRGRYQALNMLLPKIGASRFLDLQPRVIETLFSTHMRSRDICASVSSFLITLVYSLLNEVEGESSGTPRKDSHFNAGLNRFGKPIYPNRHGALKKNKERFRPGDDNPAKMSLRRLWVRLSDKTVILTIGHT